jgi:predicted transposase YbfD/YdcC
LQRTNSQEFDDKISNWLIGVSTTGKGIAVDGKTLCGSFGKEQKSVHLLSALLHQEKIVIAQRKVADKSNEITGFCILLKNIDLKGHIVTGDAMHCQVGHAIFIVRDKDGNFFFFVKDNQPSLLALIESAFENPKYEVTGEASSVSKGHGRVDSRHMIVKEWCRELANQHAFPFIKQICKITRIWTNLDGTNPKTESRYCITSAGTESVDAADCLRCAVDHWAIENSSHYVRDETFDEDRSRIRKGNAPQVMATIRNLSIGVIRLSGGKNVAEAVRYVSWGGQNRALRVLGI